MLNTLLDRLYRATPQNPWAGQRYEWLTALSNVEIGAIGAQLYVDAFGGTLIGREATHDVEHGEVLIEAKLALRSHQSKGKVFRYQWNGIRENDRWSHAWLVAVSFDRVRAFLVPRARVDIKDAKGGGQAYWVGPNDRHDTATPPNWLTDHEIRIAAPLKVPL
jgi:hypothetical protein